MSSDTGLKGKVAVVTGGASGIGAASARLLASEGAQVLILDRAIADGDESPYPSTIRCDVSSDESVQRAFARIGAIDILFNCAGNAFRNPVGDQDEAGWDAVLDTNLKGTYLCLKHALPHFPVSGGSIVNTSSVTGITGVRNRAAYSAAKGAIVALTRNMALDYAARGIRVNCICPGFVRTPFIAALLRDPDRTARLTALHPLGRLGEPEDIAEAVLFLASDRSRWMTGQALVIDGGFSAGHAEDV